MTLKCTCAPLNMHERENVSDILYNSYFDMCQCRNGDRYLKNLHMLSFDCHPFISNHVWAMSFGNTIVVAMPFEGEVQITLYTFIVTYRIVSLSTFEHLALFVV